MDTTYRKALEDIANSECSDDTTMGEGWRKAHEKFTSFARSALTIRGRNKPLYVLLASAMDAKNRCLDNGNLEWVGRWDDRIIHLVREHMPSGSGFDSGTTLDKGKSNEDRLVFTTSFHHMNEAGYYDGWTEHTITVRPSLIHGFHLTIGGRNRNDIKDYIAEVFGQCLTIRTDYEDS